MELERLSEELEKLMKQRIEIYQTISDVNNNDYRNLLKWVYYEQRSVSSYADLLCISERTGYRIFKKAVMSIKIT